MAFDGRQDESGWKEMGSTLVAMADTMLEMTQEIVKLREAMAPLLERHRQEEERREVERQEMLAYAEAQAKRCEHRAHQVSRPFDFCDCTPSRTAALAGQFNIWIDDQIARYNKTNRTP